MTATAPTVSVVIPVYNAAPYLGAAIDSVLAQARPVDQIVVVDDGSTDDTPAVIAGYRGRIVALRQDNAGGGAAMNRGIAAATGTILAFLDADDLWTPAKTARQLEILAERPAVDMVFGWVRQFISPELDPQAAARLHCPAEPQRGIAKSTMLVRRDPFMRVGGFDTTLYAADFVEWYPRACDAGLRSEMLAEVVTLRRLHRTNVGVRLRDAQRSENLDALKRMLDRRRGQG